MSDIIMSQSPELTDPQLREVAMRVVEELRLTADKAVAHYAAPEHYPMPADPQCLEQIFLARFQELSPDAQQAAMENVLAHMQAPASRQASIYGGLTAVDLHSPTPVAAQVDALPFPAALQFAANTLRTRLFQEHFRPSEARASSEVATYPSALASAHARAFSSTSTPTLALRIHAVKCLDETGEEWLGGEIGSDEIYLGGTIVDESGDTDKVPSFKVGNFDDGDIKRYAPPQVFTTFDLREGTDWPKSYFVTLVLTEKDQGGGVADYLNKLADKVRERVIIAIGAKGASGGPIGVAIAAAVTYAVTKAIEWLKTIWSDDIFPPQIVQVALPSLDASFAGNTVSPQSVITFTGHNGKYQLTYDWQLHGDTQAKGLGILGFRESLTSLQVHPEGTRFGGWLYGNGDRIVGLGDFDGDGKTEILITSGWGIGILKQQGNTIESPLLYPNNTGFGDWRYETHNTISGLGDFDGDGKTEILITSGWGIGILKQQGNSFGCLDLRAYSSMIGNWFLEADDDVVGIGNLTSAPGQELLLQKKPKNGNTVRRMRTPVTLHQ